MQLHNHMGDWGFDPCGGSPRQQRRKRAMEAEADYPLGRLGNCLRAPESQGPPSAKTRRVRCNGDRGLRRREGRILPTVT